MIMFYKKIHEIAQFIIRKTFSYMSSNNDYNMLFSIGEYAIVSLGKNHWDIIS